MDSQIQTILSILAALSPILLALLGGIGWLYRHERERRERAETQISERKRGAYLALLEIFFDMLKASDTGRKMTDRKIRDRMIDANKELILYGSDDVVRIFQTWVGNARRGTATLMEFGELIVAIRRDMGHVDTDITSHEILKQLLVDYDEIKVGEPVSVETD